MPANYSNRSSNPCGSGAPATPFGLTVVSVDNDSIELNWINPGGYSSMQIQYRGSNDVWTSLATLAGDATSYTNISLASNIARGYRVRGINGAGNSDWSNVVIGATSETGAVLHTTGHWQKVLRAWMDTHVSADFDVTLTAMPTDFSGFTDEEVWQAWYTLENRGLNSPTTAGFRRASSHFVLSAIETGGQVNMTVGRGGFLDPIATAFYAFWDHPINVQYDVEAIYKRTFVALAVDMIEGRNLHDNDGAYQRSDYAGGWLMKWTIPFWMHENHSGSADVLDENTKMAIRQCLREMWDYVMAYSAGGNGGGDLEAFQLRAMPYLYDLGIITLDEYKTKAKKVISEIVNPRGGKGFYHDHGGGTETGIDIAYEGIWFTNLANAAIAESVLLPAGTTIVKDSLRNTLDLLAHSTLIDYAPNVTNAWLGRILSASHFNTGTPGSIAYQYENPIRNWNAAYLMDEFKHQLFGWNRSVNSTPQKGVVSRTTMIDTFGLTYAVTLNYNSAGSANTGVAASSTTPTVWGFNYFGDPMYSLSLHGITGLWTELKAVLDAGTSEVRLPPVLRTSNFVKNYEHLIFARIGNLAFSTHSGPVVTTWAGNPSALRGGISSFWIKNKGIFVLGVGTGGQDNNPDTWTTHDTWAVNTVSGITSGGKFSESRFPGQGFGLDSINAISNIIVVRDSNNLTSLFKAGDKITVEDWNTGNVYKYTLAIDAVNASNLTTLIVNESLANINIFPNGGIVYSNHVETGNDYFVQETRSLIDSTKTSTTVNSATINNTIIRRLVTGNATGIHTSLEILSPGTDVITDMWEQIPIYQGRTGDTYNIEYWSGSSWVTLSTTYVTTSKIRLTRDVQAGNGNVYAYISFSIPQRVKLSSARVAPGIDNLDFVRNIKIQIFDTVIPSYKTLTYTIQENEPA